MVMVMVTMIMNSVLSLLHVLIQANLIKKLRVSGGKVGNFTMGGRERKIEREGQEKKVGIFEC